MLLFTNPVLILNFTPTEQMAEYVLKVYGDKLLPSIVPSPLRFFCKFDKIIISRKFLKSHIPLDIIINSSVEGAELCL